MTKRTARALGAATGLALCVGGATWIVAAASERPRPDGVAGSSWTMSPFTRCERYFLRAERRDEVSGQMENTAFVEGMVRFRGKWFVYYTMAEAGIGVATSDRVLD